MRNLPPLGLALALLVGLAVPAAAAERAGLGDDFVISGPSALSNEVDPAVAFSPDRQEFLIVWVDYRNDHGTDIYARRVSSTGVPQGDDFRVSRSDHWGDQLSPAVAYNPDADEYLVVWADERNVGTLLRGTDIYGRRISGDGVVQGSDIRISGRNALRDDEDPSVAYSPDAGEYLVVWVDYRNYLARGTDVYGRRVGGEGKPTGKDKRISGRAAVGREWLPALAYNSADQEFLVVWADYRSPEGRAYGRRVAPDLTFPAREFRVSSRAAEVSYHTDLAYNPDLNQYLVAWQDRRHFDTRGPDIYAVLLDAAGARQGKDRPVSATEAYEYAPSVAYQTVNDRFLIIWRAYPDDDAFLMGRGLTGTGLFAGVPFPIVAGAPAPSANADLAYGRGLGRCLVVWPEARDVSARGADIYGRFAKG